MDISADEGSGPSDNQPGPELLLSNPEYAWACLLGTPILSSLLGTAVQEKWELGVTGAACTGLEDQDLPWPFRDNLPIPLEPSHISKGNFGSPRGQWGWGDAPRRSPNSPLGVWEVLVSQGLSKSVWPAQWCH